MVQTDNESGLRLGCRQDDTERKVVPGALIVVREQRLNDDVDDPIRGSIAKLQLDGGAGNKGSGKGVQDLREAGA